MAFKMNRPIIEGTKLHKESMAKAVSAKLIEKANTLGLSDVPHAIDYGLGLTDIDVKKKEKDKGDGKDKSETKEQKTARLEQEKLDQAKQNALETQRLKKENQPDTKLKVIGSEKPTEEVVVEDPDTSSETRVRKTYKQAWDDNDEGIQQQYSSYEEYKADRLGQKKKDPEGYEKDLFEETGVAGGPGSVTIETEEEESSDDSAAKKRDNRIWRNAKKGGPVRKNMLKNGYKPR